MTQLLIITCFSNFKFRMISRSLNIPIQVRVHSNVLENIFHVFIFIRTVRRHKEDRQILDLYVSHKQFFALKTLYSVWYQLL